MLIAMCMGMLCMQNDIVQYADEWIASLRKLKQCKNRPIRALVSDSEGIHVMATRFLAPIEPPGHIHQAAQSSPHHQEAIMLSLLHFVSHIPFLHDGNKLGGKEDIWTTASEVMEIGAGDSEEHATILACYFMYLGINTYVLQCIGVREGECSYVLTVGGSGVADTQVRIWDPVVGQVHSVTDSTCEIRNVGIAFNQDNIWANVQPKGGPWTTSFDFKDVKKWRPFFSPRFPARRLGSIQSPPLYRSQPTPFFEDLEKQLEKEIMDSISNARTREKRTFTLFNRRCARFMKVGSGECSSV